MKHGMDVSRAAAVAAMVVSLAGVGSAQAPSAPAGDATFSAEVSVQRALVDDRGRVTRELPSSKYLLERRADGRLRLTMRPTRANPATGPLADAYAGIVVEQDATGALRVTGKDGAPVPGVPPMPTSAVPLASSGDEDALVARAQDTETRRGHISKTLGRRMGTVRGFDRYVVRRQKTVEEVLISPRFALPVEVNVVTGGALSERHEFTYEEHPNGRIVRTRARSESQLGASTERLVSITTLSDVRMTGGAR